MFGKNSNRSKVQSKYEGNEEATIYRVDFGETYFRAVSMCEDMMYEKSKETDNVVVTVPQRTTNSIIVDFVAIILMHQYN